MCTQTNTYTHTHRHTGGTTQDDQANIITMKPLCTVDLKVLPQGNHPPTAESWCSSRSMTTVPNLRGSNQPPHCVLNNHTVKASL